MTDGVGPVDRPPSTPAELLAFWMEWEEHPSGQVMANLKTDELEELLEELTTALRTVE